MDKWTLGLEAWIIQDGNYGDFRRGDEVELAVEFAATDLVRAGDVDAGVVFELGEGEYEAAAAVVFADPELWVVDIGICAYSDAQPGFRPAVGDRVRGRFALEVDPFTYVDRHARSPAVPPLVYTWRLERIRRRAAAGQWTETDTTDAWNDVGGYETYLLDCLRLPDPPKRTSRTAAG